MMDPASTIITGSSEAGEPLTSVKVTVSGYDDAPGYTVYAISTEVTSIECDRKHHFQSRHRYSDFVRLHEVIRKRLSLPDSIPSYMRWLWTDSAKKERKQHLQLYLDMCVANSGHRLIEPLRRFLNAYEVLKVHPTVVSSVFAIANGACCAIELPRRAQH